MGYMQIINDILVHDRGIINKAAIANKLNCVEKTYSRYLQGLHLDALDPETYYTNLFDGKDGLYQNAYNANRFSNDLLPILRDRNLFPTNHNFNEFERLDGNNIKFDRNYFREFIIFLIICDKRNAIDASREKEETLSKIVAFLQDNYQMLQLLKFGGREEEVDYQDTPVEKLYVCPELFCRKDYCTNWTDYNKNNNFIRSLIVAPNGYGKTSLIKSILFCSIYHFYISTKKWKKTEEYETYINFHNINDFYLPILLDSDSFNDTNYTSFNDLIKKTFKKKILGLDDNIIEQLLLDYNNKKKILLLIDGYDEINEEKQNSLNKYLSAFLQDYPYSNVIITTRPSTNIMSKLPREFLSWEIAPLSFDNELNTVTLLTEKYLKIGANKYKLDSSEAINILQNNKYLRQLVVSPYMLMWTLYHTRKNASPYTIITDIVNTLITRQKIEYGQIRDASHALLSQISYNLVCKNKPIDFTIDATNINNIFENARQEARKLYQFKNIFENTSIEELVYIIKVNIGITIPIGTTIEFQAKELFPLYLAAWWIVQISYNYYVEERNQPEELLDSSIIRNSLKKINPLYRYQIILFYLSILYCSSNEQAPNTLDNDHAIYFSKQAIDYMLTEYIHTLDLAEKEHIEITFIDILLDNFGKTYVTGNSDYTTEYQLKILKTLFQNISNEKKEYHKKQFDSITKKYTEQLNELYARGFLQ